MCATLLKAVQVKNAPKIPCDDGMYLVSGMIACNNRTKRLCSFLGKLFLSIVWLLSPAHESDPCPRYERARTGPQLSSLPPPQSVYLHLGGDPIEL